MDGQCGQCSKWAEPGGPTGNRKPNLHRAKFLFKTMGLGLSKKKGRWVMTIRPNNIKELKKRLAHVSLLGLLASKFGEFKTELPKLAFDGESLEQETPPLDQGRGDSLLKSFMPGMFPFSIAFGGVFGESSGLSSPSISGMGDSVEYSQAWQPEGTYEDPSEIEVSLCMVLKDGRSFTLPGINGDNCQVGGNETTTLRPQGNED